MSGCFDSVVQQPLIGWIVIVVCTHVAAFMHINKYTLPSMVCVIVIYSLTFLVGLVHYIQQCWKIWQRSTKLHTEQLLSDTNKSDLYQSIMLQTIQLSRLLSLPCPWFVPFHLTNFSFATVGLGTAIYFIFPLSWYLLNIGLTISFMFMMLPFSINEKCTSIIDNMNKNNNSNKAIRFDLVGYYFFIVRFFMILHALGCKGAVGGTLAASILIVYYYGVEYCWIFVTVCLAFAWVVCVVARWFNQIGKTIQSIETSCTKYQVDTVNGCDRWDNNNHNNNNNNDNINVNVNDINSNNGNNKSICVCNNESNKCRSLIETACSKWKKNAFALSYAIIIINSLITAAGVTVKFGMSWKQNSNPVANATYASFYVFCMFVTLVVVLTAKMSVKLSNCTTKRHRSKLQGDTHFRVITMFKVVLFSMKAGLVINGTNVNSNDEAAADVVYEVLMFCTLTMIAFLTFTNKYNILKQHISNKFYKTYLLSYTVGNFATYYLLVILICYAQRFYLFTALDGRLHLNSQSDHKLIYHIVYPQIGWILAIKMYHNEIVQYTKFIAMTVNTSQAKRDIVRVHVMNLQNRNVRSQLSGSPKTKSMNHLSERFTCVTLQSIQFWQQTVISGCIGSLIYNIYLMGMYAQIGATTVIVVFQTLIVAVILIVIVGARKELLSRLNHAI